MQTYSELRKSFQNFKQINPYDLHTNSKVRPQSARPSTSQSQSNKGFKAPEQKNQKQRQRKRPQTATQNKQTQSNLHINTQNIYDLNKADRYNSARSQVHFQHQGENELCFLDKSDLPPVTEIDHHTLRCFCNKCTCGKHQCPSQRKIHLYPKNMYKSNYKNLFRKVQTPKPEKSMKNQQYQLKNHFKLDGLTQKQVDFQFFTFPQNYNPQQDLEKNKPQSSLFNQKFCFSSQYTSQYPNWGPTYPQKAGPLHLQVRSGELHLDDRTQYKQDFKNPSILTVQGSPIQRSSSSVNNRKAPFAQSYQTPMEDMTQYKKDFKNSEGLQTNNMKRTHNIYSYVNPSGSYLSTYNTTFKGKQPENYLELRGGKKNLIAI